MALAAGQPTPTSAYQPRRLALVLVSLLYLSFHLWGVYIFHLPRGIDAAPWDIAAVAVSIVWVLHALRNRLRFPAALRRGAFLIALLMAVMMAYAIISPQPLRAATMLMMMARNLAIFVVVGTLISYLPTLEHLNRSVFFVAVGIAAPTLVLYALNYDNLSARYPLGETVLLVDSGHIPRLTGLSGRPNFFALLMAPGLFCGLSGLDMKPRLRWIGVAVVAVAIAMSLSRTAVVAVPTALIAVWGYHSLRSGGIYKSSRAAMVAVLSIAMLILLPIMFSDFGEWVAFRTQTVESTPRFEMWRTLISGPYALIVGNGLRSAEETLGKYSHNTYLDLLYETSVLGLAVFGLFIGYVLRKAIKLSKVSDVSTPWLETLLATLVFASTLSLLYLPFLWMVAAVILSQWRKASSQRADG